MVANPKPSQNHPHTRTMREKRLYNGALLILAVFEGRASGPASQGGWIFQSRQGTQLRLGAAPLSAYFDTNERCHPQRPEPRPWSWY